MVHNVTARFERLGLQRRIMIYVTAGLVAFSVIFGFVALQAIHESSTLVFRERLLVAMMVARELDNSIVHIQREIQETSASIPLPLTGALPRTERNSGDVQNALRALYDHWVHLHGFQTLTRLSLTDIRGDVLLTEPYSPDLIGRRLAQESGLPDAFQFQPAAIAEGVTVDARSSSVILVVVPVSVDQQTTGFLVGEINRGYAAKWLEPLLGADTTGYLAEVVDNAGFVVATNGRGKPFTPSLHQHLVAPSMSSRQSGVWTHALHVNGKDVSHVIAFAPLQQLPWGVIIEQRVDEALMLPRKLQGSFIALGLLALLGGVTLAWATTRTVVRPIRALIEAAQDIARGNLDVPLDISGGDEVGVLARTFDDMRVALQQSRSEIALWNQELESRVRQRTSELTALVESSHALTSTLNLDALFAILMEKVQQVFPAAEGSALFLFEPETRILAVHSSDGFDADERGRLRFHIGEGIAGKVFESQRPLLLESPTMVRAAQTDFSDANRAHFLRAVSDRVVQSALGVPLVSKGTQLGALVLSSFSRQRAFNGSDVPMLQALADQAAAAIENARLYAELQKKEAVRAQLLEKIIDAQEEERKRIARELHDEFAQTLTALMINLQFTSQNLPADMNGLKQHLEATQALTAQILREISQLILELRPTVLDDLGLVPALRWYAESRLEPAGTRVHVEATGLKHRLPTGMETALFRIVQEAVNNIAKHACAHAVHIRLAASETQISVEVEDDGIGFKSEEAFQVRDGMRGLGLLGIRERASLLGGILTIDSHFEQGTHLKVDIPWTKVP